MPPARHAGAESPRADPGDFKQLFRKLERALVTIERTENVTETLEQILDALLGGFREELGFRGGRIHRREGDQYVVCCGFGEGHASPFGFQVPHDYPPHRRVLDQGVVIIRQGDPDFDENIQRAMGVETTFAAIAVGPGNRFVITFSIDRELEEERVLYSLTAVRHVINLKLEQQKLTGMLEEARLIQESMLPDSPPELPGYEIAGASWPAEIVSGDLFDYLPLPGGRLGVAIADASGHGVGAALIARDAITGLRMLAASDLPPAEAMASLNRVVHRQALSSKFVALVYAQLATDGELVYCNAGHDPPLLRRPAGWGELPPGGPVLGPLPGAHYDARRVRLEPGELLVMFTDGLVDQESPAGEPFGTDRLRRAVAASSRSGATAVLAAVRAAVEAHADGTSQGDDVTVVVVARDPA